VVSKVRKGTGISWTDETWNPTVGCSRVSPGCVNCYAEHAAAMVNRTQGKKSVYSDLLRVVDGDPRWNGTVKLVPERLDHPFHWKAPRRIFVNSMSDLFHESLSNEDIAAVFGVMAAAVPHTFQVLTKRAKRMRDWFRWAASHSIGDQPMKASAVCCEHADRVMADKMPGGVAEYRRRRWTATPMQWPLPNVWLGVSVENQDAADERIPELLETPAAVRFLSCEPLIGEVSLDRPRCDVCDEVADSVAGDGATPWCSEHERECSYGHWLGDPVDGIRWVIVGCESGAGARVCDVAWLRALRDQCADADVAFFLKQAVEDLGDADRVCKEERGCRGRVRYHVLGPKDTAVSCGCTTEGAEVAAWCPTLGAGDESKRKPGGVIELPYLDGVQHATFPEDHDAS
jgi:protein gp37